MPPVETISTPNSSASARQNSTTPVLSVTETSARLISDLLHDCDSPAPVQAAVAAIVRETAGRPKAARRASPITSARAYCLICFHSPPITLYAEIDLCLLVAVRVERERAGHAVELLPRTAS